MTNVLESYRKIKRFWKNLRVGGMPLMPTEYFILFQTFKELEVIA